MELQDPSFVEVSHMLYVAVLSVVNPEPAVRFVFVTGLRHAFLVQGEKPH